MVKRWKFIFLGLILTLLFLAACQPQTKELKNDERVLSEGPDWRTAVLTDVRTGEEFSISDFKGKPVLLESFAVWCPTCLQQQKKIDELRGSDGDTVIHISIDTDPNEDEAKVKEHAERNGFEWFFSVSPIEVTGDLIDEFGLGVVNAPSSPIVLICKDQSARLLKRGVKSAQDLKGEIEKGC